MVACAKVSKGSQECFQLRLPGYTDALEKPFQWGTAKKLMHDPDSFHRLFGRLITDVMSSKSLGV
jgi:hypothetical protein